MENDQANTLSGADPDVSKYTVSVDWSQLRTRTTTPEPEVYGYSNRWYATPLDLSSYGAGVRAADSSTYTGPTYLSRIQPYAVYVPTSYDFSHPSPTPLTWVLHSLGANLNQYGTVAPSQLAEVCQDRHSICATTEGFSAGQWYYAEAEVDFWDVWHQLALSYDLDPDAATVTGYSMGGWASYKLAEEYPDVFAQAEPLEGPVICGERVYGPVQGFAGGTQCTSDGDSTPLLGNLQWIPYVSTCGGIDELVPVTGCHTQASTMMAAGLRIDEFLYPTEDHIVFSVQNDFAPPDAALGPTALDRRADPGRFSFTWYPDLYSGAKGIDGAGPAGQIGPTSDYWLTGLAGRATAPGRTASVNADSAALPDPTVTTARSTTANPQPDPTPYVENAQSWNAGAAPPPQPTVVLHLANVAAATLDTTAAGLTCGTVTVQTDGPTALTLIHLAAGQPVTVAGASQSTGSDNTVVHLGAGTTAIGLCSARGAVPASVPESPAAGGLLAAALGVAGALVYRRRRTRPPAAA
jgi:pimeloyl-ACP methyl ester carboxylesterase